MVKISLTLLLFIVSVSSYAYNIIIMDWDKDGLVERGFRDGIISVFPETRFYTYGAGGDEKLFKQLLNVSKSVKSDLYFTSGLEATRELLNHKDIPPKVFVSIQYQFQDELFKDVDFDGSFGVKTYIPIHRLLVALGNVIVYRKLGVLKFGENKNFDYSISEIKSFSKELGFEAVTLNATDIFEFNRNLADVKPDAIYIPAHGAINKSIFDVIQAHNIPTIAEDAEDVRSKGGLLSLIVDRYRAGRLAAIKAVKVLRRKEGVRDRITPIEHFMFVVNMMTAKRLGVQIPMQYLIIADHIVK